jgi:hypothetical protein
MEKDGIYDEWEAGREETIDRWRNIYARPARGEIQARDPSGRHAARSEALGAFVKHQTTESVADYRSTHLESGVLAPSEVGPWVDRCLAVEQPGDWPDWASTINRESLFVPGPVNLFIQGAVELSWREPAVTGSVARKWWVPPGGALAALETLSAEIEQRYSLLPEDAVQLILCDVTPVVPRATFRWQYKTGDNSHDAFSRVQLEVDPTVTPAELDEIWRKVRARVAPGRIRSQGERALRLAEWTLTATESGTWEDGRRAWNDLHPEWAYANRTFASHAKEAVRRLVRVGYRQR